MQLGPNKSGIFLQSMCYHFKKLWHRVRTLLLIRIVIGGQLRPKKAKNPFTISPNQNQTKSLRHKTNNQKNKNKQKKTQSKKPPKENKQNNL